MTDKHIKELRANLNRMRHFKEWGEVGFATGERIAGYNAAVDEMLEHLREMGLDDDTGIDRGAWSDVKDATKWVDELRGDEEPPNSTTDVVEPVAWLWKNKDGHQVITDDPDYADGTWTPLYTAPPKREWVGLTDEEIHQVHQSVEYNRFMSPYRYAHEVIKESEAKLKEKNGF